MENLRMLANSLTEAIREEGGSFKLDGNPIQNGYLIGGGILKTDDALATIELESFEYDEANDKILEALRESESELGNFDGLGIWVSDGVIYLDAINVEVHRLDAIELGHQRKQQAIGHLSKGNYTEITLRH